MQEGEKSKAGATAVLLREENRRKSRLSFVRKQPARALGWVDPRFAALILKAGESFHSRWLWWRKEKGTWLSQSQTDSTNISRLLVSQSDVATCVVVQRSLLRDE